jgi:hypothetical protein
MQVTTSMSPRRGEGKIFLLTSSFIGLLREELLTLRLQAAVIC